MSKQKQKSKRDIKKDKVGALTEKIGRAKTLTFANYHGLSAGQIAELRAKIKLSGGEFLVEKNTLVKLSLKSNNLDAPASGLTGPTAAILAYDDEIAPIREIAQSKKAFGFPTFKFGFFGKDLLDFEALEKLANLPARQTLEAQVVGSLASPISGFVNVLSANIRNLVSILEQVAKRPI